MKTKDIVLTLLVIGVAFNMIGRAMAVDMECKFTEPHVGAPVCVEKPLGPRFTARR
jgi:hypothetical protein